MRSNDIPVATRVAVALEFPGDRRAVAAQIGRDRSSSRSQRDLLVRQRPFRSRPRAAARRPQPPATGSPSCDRSPLQRTPRLSIHRAPSPLKTTAPAPHPDWLILDVSQCGGDGAFVRGDQLRRRLKILNFGRISSGREFTIRRLRLHAQRKCPVVHSNARVAVSSSTRKAAASRVC